MVSVTPPCENSLGEAYFLQVKEGNVSSSTPRATWSFLYVQLLISWPQALQQGKWLKRETNYNCYFMHCSHRPRQLLTTTRVYPLPRSGSPQRQTLRQEESLTILLTLTLYLYILEIYWIFIGYIGYIEMPWKNRFFDIPALTQALSSKEVALTTMQVLSLRSALQGAVHTKLSTYFLSSAFFESVVPCLISEWNAEPGQKSIWNYSARTTRSCWRCWKENTWRRAWDSLQPRGALLSQKFSLIFLTLSFYTCFFLKNS